MAVMMGFFMSLVMTAVNVGFPPTFFKIWMRGFGVGVLVAFPVSLFVAPAARKLSGKIIKEGV